MRSVSASSAAIWLNERARVPTSSCEVAVTRFDRRIRVGGMAELAGHDFTLRSRRRRTLEMVVESLFPGGGNLAAGEFWTGLRPMTPDSTPIVGPTPVGGLFLNTGHGTLGWTMAAGSGRLVADMVLGRRPDIDTDGLDLDRYRRRSGQHWTIRAAT